MSQENVKWLVSMMDDRYLNDYWFLPLTQALEGVSAAQAAWRPEGHANTIWQIVNHLTFWNGTMLNRIEGNTEAGKGVPNDTTFGDSGEAANEETWKDDVERLHNVYTSLRDAVADMTDADLNTTIGENPLPLGQLLGDLVMHDAYHTGQIVLLRKLQGSWPAQR